MLHLGLDAGIESPFGLEELVAGRTEPFVDAVIILLGCKTDGFPRFLNLQQTFAGLIPLLAGGRRLRVELLGCGAKFGLEFEVFTCSALSASKCS